MKKRMTKIVCCLVFGGAFLWLLPSIGLSQCNVTVGGSTYSSIQVAINSTTSSLTTISVTGTCSENVVINENRNYFRLTVPTGETATIAGLDPNMPTITILGKAITIENFTIRGASDGIQVLRGGTAFIENNVIENTGRYGVVVAFNSYAQIRGNRIQNNPDFGISISDSSFARIGIRTNSDTTAIGNTIQGNGYGVIVARSSSAQIIGNRIVSNTYDGVVVSRVSQADISDNTIDGNGQNGILVVENSGVNLGSDTGERIFDLPNGGVTGNGAYGLECAIGGYANGRLGTLGSVNKKAPTSFTKDCINSLIP